MENFDEVPSELLDMMLAVLSGQAEMHVVEIEFTQGTCMGCGVEDHALLPVGPNDYLVCHNCGTENQDNLREFLKKAMAQHMRGHAAQWN